MSKNDQQNAAREAAEKAAREAKELAELAALEAAEAEAAELAKLDKVPPAPVVTPTVAAPAVRAVGEVRAQALQNCPSASIGGRHYSFQKGKLVSVAVEHVATLEEGGWIHVLQK